MAEAEDAEVLDLTNEPAQTEAAPLPKQVPVERQREGTRGNIALGLLGLIALLVLGAFAAVAWDWATADELKDLLTAIFNPLVGLFGAIIGFYFGSMGNDGGRVTTRPTGGSDKG